MKAYNTIYEGGTDEIVEKKSRFIAQVFPVETEEEVATILEQMKKKYWDADILLCFRLGRNFTNLKMQ